MTIRTKTTAYAKTAQISNYQSWFWIGLLLALLTLFSVSITACSSAPDAVKEAATALPLEVSVDEAYELYQDGTLFLDVRTQQEWDDFHTPNSTHIPLDQLESRMNELPKNEEIVVVCRSGNRSRTGRDILLNNGFSQVTSLAGGLIEWRTAGYPIE